MSVWDLVAPLFDHTDLVWSCAITLAIIGMAMIAHMTESTILALVYAPWIGLGGLAGDTAFNQLNFSLTEDATSNSIFAAAAGSALTLLSLLMLTRVLTAFSMVFVRRPLSPSKRPLLAKAEGPGTRRTFGGA